MHAKHPSGTCSCVEDTYLTERRKYPSAGFIINFRVVPIHRRVDARHQIHTAVIDKMLTKVDGSAN